MAIRFTPTEIPGVILVEPDVFKDERGFFSETFHRKKYAEGGIDHDFVQDNHSHSLRGVLRGLHYQEKFPQGKLVYCAAGEIFDVAVDIRRSSPAFGKWVGHILSGENHKQLHVPEGCVHGFCTLSDEADVMYKCTALYVPSDDRGIIWNDPTFAIQWPIKDPNLSPKDSRLPSFKELPENSLPIFAD
jgi:dTDP-4-dehydrorhamnose 3,5-epimerase